LIARIYSDHWRSKTPMVSNRFWHIVSVVKERGPPVQQKGKSTTREVWQWQGEMSTRDSRYPQASTHQPLALRFIRAALNQDKWLPWSRDRGICGQAKAFSYGRHAFDYQQPTGKSRRGISKDISHVGKLARGAWKSKNGISSVQLCGF
jgi:hypothetical protein